MTKEQIDEMLDDLGVVDNASPVEDRERNRAIVRSYLTDEPRCPRCGAPFLPHGQCSRHLQGCQGGIGEAAQVQPQELTERARLLAMMAATMHSIDFWVVTEMVTLAERILTEVEKRQK